MILKANRAKLLFLLVWVVGLAKGQSNLKDESSVVNFLCKQYEVKYLNKELKGYKGAGFNSYSDLKGAGLEFSPFGKFDLDSIFTQKQRKELEEKLIHTSKRQIKKSEPPKEVKLMDYQRDFKKGEIFGFSRVLIQEGKENISYAIVLVSKDFAQNYWSEWYLILRKEGEEWKEIFRNYTAIS